MNNDISEPYNDTLYYYCIVYCKNTRIDKHINYLDYIKVELERLENNS